MLLEAIGKAFAQPWDSSEIKCSSLAYDDPRLAFMTEKSQAGQQFNFFIISTADRLSYCLSPQVHLWLDAILETKQVHH